MVESPYILLTPLYNEFKGTHQDRINQIKQYLKDLFIYHKGNIFTNTTIGENYSLIEWYFKDILCCSITTHLNNKYIKLDSVDNIYQASLFYNLCLFIIERYNHINDVILQTVSEETNQWFYLLYKELDSCEYIKENNIKIIKKICN